MKLFIVIALFAMTVVLAMTVNAADEELPFCMCTREYAPVCATNGRTYSNPCEFKCAKGQLVGRAAEELRILRYGDCEGQEMNEFNNGDFE